MTPTERGDWLPDPDELECGYRTSVGYIIGGETAKRGEFPFTALIGYGGLRVCVIDILYRMSYFICNHSLNIEGS